MITMIRVFLFDRRLPLLNFFESFWEINDFQIHFPYQRNDYGNHKCGEKKPWCRLGGRDILQQVAITADIYSYSWYEIRNQKSQRLKQYFHTPPSFSVLSSNCGSNGSIPAYKAQAAIASFFAFCKDLLDGFAFCRVTSDGSLLLLGGNGFKIPSQPLFLYEKLFQMFNSNWYTTGVYGLLYAWLFSQTTLI